MRKRVPSLVLVASLTTISCAPSKLDATSDETVKASLATMTDKLPAADRQKFVGSIMLLSMEGVRGQGGFISTAEAIRSSGHPSAVLLKSLHGKTAREIMAEADRVRAERAERLKKRL